MHNVYQVLKVTAVSQIIGHKGAHGHMQTQKLAINYQPQVLYLCFKPLATWGYMDTRRHISSQ